MRFREIAKEKFYFYAEKRPIKVWDVNAKDTVTDMRYFARIKFSRSLVHKKNFSLIWQVVFKLGHVFCQERLDNSFGFEWTQRKVASDFVNEFSLNL